MDAGSSGTVGGHSRKPQMMEKPFEKNYLSADNAGRGIPLERLDDGGPHSKPLRSVVAIADLFWGLL